ncbi:MAG: AAA family ATPase, partial [Gammaproteobacteria bacterium]|nr:AAA family ATPase [Gammaproteobacteria bacterium]MDX1336306.1 AAA family ATPase [Gammaproteobacteria bacterium]
MVKPHPIRVIAVASGKGGVGKTNVSVNLGVTLARQGKNVLLMDADLGLANVDVMLGLKPEYNLSHLFNGERTLEELIVQGPEGLNIIPAASGISRMADLEPAEHSGLIQAFSEL